MKAALSDAVARLRPFDGVRLRECEVTRSWFGQVDLAATDAEGRRYRRVSEQRCWIIVDDHSDYPSRMRTPVLLTADGRLGRITASNALRCSSAGVFAIHRPLEPIRNDSVVRERIPTGRPGSYETGGFDVGVVKRKLADVIVAHKRNRDKNAVRKR